ncbi:hypothetical protein GCM10008997_38580 [Halomonas salifodinae]
MIFQLLLVITLSTGVEYTSSGPLATESDCQERAQAILNAYPRGSVRGFQATCLPGYRLWYRL